MALNGDHVSELKQQGAIEAAQDPKSSVTSEDAQRKILHETRASGAQAFAFDPNASPGEKARQAKAHMPPELQNISKNKVATLVSDQVRHMHFSSWTSD